MERWTPKLKQEQCLPGFTLRMWTDKDGEYVLYTDHIAETRKLIDTYDLLISQEDKKIAELEAENKRLAALNDMFPQEIARLEDRVSAEYEAERADDRARIKELEAERDADRKREYGYSQQTVDALTLERDKLTAERSDWKARYQSVAEMHDALIAEFNEMRAENKRLRMYRDAAESRAQGLEVERDAAVKWLEEYKSKTYCAYCGAIFNIDSDASHVSEHIRTCPHHPMRELEAENDELDRIAVTMCRQKNELEAENKRLRELVDAAAEAGGWRLRLDRA